jgi:hypothetical protein
MRGGLSGAAKDQAPRRLRPPRKPVGCVNSGLGEANSQICRQTRVYAPHTSGERQEEAFRKRLFKRFLSRFASVSTCSPVSVETTAG